MTLFSTVKKKIHKYYLDSYTEYFNFEISSSKSNETLYPIVLDQLNCVDSKSSSLLTYNGLSAAMVTFLLGAINSMDFDGLISYGLKICILTLLFSSLLCLLCIDIFSPHIIREGMTDCEYIEKVKLITYTRTGFYRVALKLTQINALLLLLIFVIYVLIS